MILGLAAVMPSPPTGCFLSDSRFFLVPFVDLAFFVVFLVAIIFLQSVAEQRPSQVILTGPP